MFWLFYRDKHLQTLSRLRTIMATGQDNGVYQPKRALLLNKNDDVAMVLSCVSKGEQIDIVSDNDVVKVIIAADDIDTYHKVAVRDLTHGIEVHKYGEVIGVTTEHIKEGHWVHVHNLESKVFPVGNKSL